MSSQTADPCGTRTEIKTSLTHCSNGPACHHIDFLRGALADPDMKPQPIGSCGSLANDTAVENLSLALLGPGYRWVVCSPPAPAPKRLRDIVVHGVDRTILWSSDDSEPPGLQQSLPLLGLISLIHVPRAI